MQARTSRRELAIGVPASAAAGLVVGTIGTFKHQFGISAATGTGLPIGLVLSLAMVVVLLAALRVSFPTRWYAGGAAAGIVAAVALLTLPGASGGSTVVLLNVPGIVWSIAPAVLGAVVVGWPRLAKRPPRSVPALDGILDVDGARRPDAEQARRPGSSERRTSE